LVQNKEMARSTVCCMSQIAAQAWACYSRADLGQIMVQPAMTVNLHSMVTRKSRRIKTDAWPCPWNPRPHFSPTPFVSSAPHWVLPEWRSDPRQVTAVAAGLVGGDPVSEHIPVHMICSPPDLVFLICSVLKHPDQLPLCFGGKFLCLISTVKFVSTFYEIFKQCGMVG
jgi:hypothetical protein